MQKDRLIQIFNHYLENTDPDTSNLNDLVYNTVGDYMAHLMELGNIPPQLLDQVEEDLKDEVIEIYRKTTYGFLTLKEFSLAQKTKRRLPQT